MVLRVICSSDGEPLLLLYKALSVAPGVICRISVLIDTSDEADAQVLALIKGLIGIRFVVRHWADLMCRLALEAVCTVSADHMGMQAVNIERYTRGEKVPSGEVGDSRVLSGDVVKFEGRRKCRNTGPWVRCA